MKYFLIGMPGCGKSTLGLGLAEQLSFQYVDLDHLIEARENMSIPELFEKYGQDYFRAKETEALNYISAQTSNLVVSTGGGAPCFNDNMLVVNKNGTSIFIDVSIDELFKRLKQAEQNRPLVKGLSDDELYNKLEKMSEERLPFYKQAKICIKGDNLSIVQILKGLKEKT